jgi:hypothetical protein
VIALLLVLLPAYGYAAWKLGVECRPGWLYDRHEDLRLRVRAVVRELDRRSDARKSGEQMGRG